MNGVEDRAVPGFTLPVAATEVSIDVSSSRNSGVRISETPCSALPPATSIFPMTTPIPPPVAPRNAAPDSLKIPSIAAVAPLTRVPGTQRADLDGSYLTPIQVSVRTGIPKTRLAAWRRDGRGPVFVKRGSRIEYPLRELEVWLESFWAGSEPVESRKGA